MAQMKRYELTNLSSLIPEGVEDILTPKGIKKMLRKVCEVVEQQSNFGIRFYNSHDKLVEQGFNPGVFSKSAILNLYKAMMQPGKKIPNEVITLQLEQMARQLLQHAQKHGGPATIGFTELLTEADVRKFYKKPVVRDFAKTLDMVDLTQCNSLVVTLRLRKELLRKITYESRRPDPSVTKSSHQQIAMEPNQSDMATLKLSPSVVMDAPTLNNRAPETTPIQRLSNAAESPEWAWIVSTLDQNNISETERLRKELEAEMERKSFLATRAANLKRKREQEQVEWLRSKVARLKAENDKEQARLDAEERRGFRFRDENGA